jgi:hypothetical protein
VRIDWKPAILCVVFTFLVAVACHATPIKPDLKKLLAQPVPKAPVYIPARAGWDGPEQKPPQESIYFQRYGPQASARAMRANLLAAAVPDWRTVLGLVALIFLLRRLRKASPEQHDASDQKSSAEIPRAA